MARRTTHRSSSGKKLYAVRDKSGRFKDIQSYQRASAADQRRKSKKEKAAARKKAARKKAAGKKTTRRKVARRKTTRRKTARKK